MKKNFEKLLAVVIAVCMLAAMLALPAVTFADTWDGSVSEALDGEGTEEAPYLIASAADLAYFAAQVNGGNDYSGKYVKVTDDIDLNNIAFTPIGNTSAYFRGNFDGDNHTVSGLNISSDSSGGIAFFGACHNATVKNINVQGNVTATISKVAVAGFMGVATGVTIKNCTFDGTVYSANNLVSNGSGGYSVNEQNNLSAGGLVCNVTGYLSVDHCAVSGTVDGFGRCGGLIAAVNGNFTANVTNSYCAATVTGKGAVDESLSNLYTSGGLVGFLNTGTVNLTNCFFAGTAAKARPNGMAGPVIHHYAGGVLNCTNTYYDSDKNTSESAGNEYGTPATSEEFADGTVLALLNTNPEEPVFEQGEFYPVFYVNKCEHTDVAAEWTTDKTNHWHACNDCGEKFDVAAHTESDWIIDTPATEEATGLKHKECTVCGYVLEEQVIPVYNPYAWDGTVSESIDGEGTEELPYIIANGADLAYFNAQVNGGNDYSGKYIKVVSDIDLNTEPVEPIGNTSAYFRGIFDGDGHTISGLNISSASANGIGFFGACHNASVKNLNVKGNVTAAAAKVAVAGLIGVATGVTIKNCTFDGTVYASNNLVSNGAGGYSINDQNYMSAAGLVCSVTGILNIDRCAVSGTIDGFGRSGGLIGSVNGNFTANITNSYCDATVTGKGAIDESFSHLYTAGGLIGFLNTGTVNLKNCFFAGTAPTPRANGMAGPVIHHYAGGVLNCTNTYYDSDKNTAESAGNEYGTPATSEEFADGTVTDLLNGDAEEPIFEQGDTHPVFYTTPCTHENTAVVEAVASTCKTRGHAEYTVCTDCGEVLEGDDTPLALDPTNHEGGTEVRDKADATCTEAGYTGDTYCLGCNTKLATGEAIGALSHNFVDYVSDNNATCTSDGTKTAKCTRCDATDTIADAGSMLAHNVGEWITDANGHHRHCADCDQDVDAGEHTYEWVITKEATAEENGLREEICSVCGYKSGNSEEIIYSTHIAGDINGDGSLNNKDLTRLFQYLSDWDVEVNEAALDINGDGSVNNKDLTRLFQYLSDWDVEIF